jgi:heme A synthase
MLAGQMFVVHGYLGIVCGTYLLAWRFALSGRAAMRESVFLVVAAMLLLTLLSQFGIQPLMAELKAQALPLEVSQSAYAGEFRKWHGISSIAYLLQSLLGAFLVIRTYGK